MALGTYYEPSGYENAHQTSNARAWADDVCGFIMMDVSSEGSKFPRVRPSATLKML